MTLQDTGKEGPAPATVRARNGMVWLAGGIVLLWAALPLAWWKDLSPLAMGVLWLGLAAVLVMAALRHCAAPILLREDEPPRFLLREGGVLRPLNGPAHDMSASGGSLFASFASGVDGGAAALYRLGREAEFEGSAETKLRYDGRSWRLRAEQGKNGQVWQLLRDRASNATLPQPSAPPPAQDGLAAPEADLALDHLPVSLARLDGAGRILFVNAAARKLLGEGARRGVLLGDLIEGLGKPMQDRIRDTICGRAQGRSEVARASGAEVDGFLQVTMTRTDATEPPTILVVMSDATELKTLEAQFVQSQKMQAVGQLAGGIAHDFNNLLTAITGHCDLLLLRHLQGDGDHADLMQIRQNANRAAALVRQLLAFSRKQTLRPQVLHLYDTLDELANLLNRLLGEKVELRIENSDDLWPIRVDERQLEQVIVNLVVNARDAMPSGGVVSLRTRKLILDVPIERDRAVVPPGEYCVIEVADTGVGIPRDRLGKIFEPFYTTKKVGEGTGLGLSTAYGIIKQMDGFIFVDSTPGVGPVFQIYLPAHLEAEPEAALPAPLESHRHRDTAGRGVVLLVEDEAPVRAFAARALQIRGYTVVEADSGEAALALLEDPDLEVDLFVSDVVMPGLDGPSWVRRAYEKRPGASTVFVSGYSVDMFGEGRAEVPRSSYLPKPFTLNDLIERVRDHMERYAS